MAAVAFLIAAALVTADTLLWLHAERRLDQGLKDVLVAARAAGWDVAAQAGTRGGWPLRATLTLMRPHLRGHPAGLPTTVTWVGEELAIGLSPLHPDRLSLMPRGTQALAVETPGAPAAAVRFWGSEIALHVARHMPDAKGAATLDARALHLAVAGPVAATGPDDVATLAGLSGRVSWNLSATRADTALGISLDGRGLSLPPSIPWVPDRVIGTAAIRVAFTGPARRDAVSAERKTDSWDAGAWAAGGGRLLIQELSAGWGNGNGASLSGTASPTADGALDGRFTLMLSGADRTIERMSRENRIEPGTAMAARAVLGLIQRARDSGEADRGGTAPVPAGARPAADDKMFLPLTLRDGMLRLGQIPLARVPLPALR
ncbi:DUF2125 domain-containing protein [Rhizosaccharibacter radicis]|uniref:DUF2125 domain-containing protein n=1 Tax=Rhizosaccharibacter radicis TaxID=2782605 RepID=A0ABT1W006_9PROT|nr:DUF2125 domain-containing protein [Acetobacteraceae bacterium KSS12]